MKKYSEIQKQEALNMIDEIGIYKTKQTLGIPTTTLYRWKDQQEKHEKPEVFGGQNRAVEDLFVEELPGTARQNELEKKTEGITDEAFIEALMNQLEELQAEKKRLINQNGQFRKMIRVLLEA